MKGAFLFESKREGEFFGEYLCLEKATSIEMKAQPCGLPFAYLSTKIKNVAIRYSGHIETHFCRYTVAYLKDEKALVYFKKFY